MSTEPDGVQSVGLLKVIRCDIRLTIRANIKRLRIVCSIGGGGLRIVSKAIGLIHNLIPSRRVSR